MTFKKAQREMSAKAIGKKLFDSQFENWTRVLSEVKGKKNCFKKEKHLAVMSHTKRKSGKIMIKNPVLDLVVRMITQPKRY